MITRRIQRFTLHSTEAMADLTIKLSPMKMQCLPQRSAYHRCFALLLSFFVRFLVGQSLVGQDVSQFGILKGVSYHQVMDGALSLNQPLPYSFIFFANGANQSLVAGDLGLPTGSLTQVTPTNGNSLELRSSFSTAAALESVYPPGEYDLIFVTAFDGVRSALLAFPISVLPPGAQIKDFQSVQAINPTVSFTLEWNALAGGTSSDYVQASISSPDGSQTLFETPQFGQVGALDGTSTSVVIPADTLSEGQLYQLRLIFAKIVGVETDYSFGFSAYFSQTEVQIATTGTKPAPTLVINEINPNQWHLHANGVIGQNYLIESTTSLNSPVVWKPMVNFIGSNSGFDFTDGVIHPQNFYRTRPVN